MQLFRTGIGSVPFRSIDDAVRFAFEFEIPFLPEIPSPSARVPMIERAVQVIHGVWPPETALFLQQAKKRAVRSLKIQIAGPLTLSSGSSQAMGRDFRASIDLHRYVECVSQWVEHCQRIADAEVLLFLDEPVLTDDSGGLQEVVTALQHRGIRVGVHCCNRFSLTTLISLHPDWIALDACLMKDSLLSQSEVLRNYFDIGGQVLWGVVPTSTLEVADASASPEAASGVSPRAPAWSALELVAWLKTLSPSVSSLWISPACGLAHWPEARAWEIPSALHSWGQKLSTL